LIAMVLLSLFLRLLGVARPRRFNTESDGRGLRLLKNWLSPAQLRSYEKHEYFEVIGSDSAKIYRIHHGTQANIEQLDTIGQPVHGWCFIPEGNLVAGDVMLAQKIALETNERAALAVAAEARSCAIALRRMPRYR
jgi:hypothetical protein